MKLRPSPTLPRLLIAALSTVLLGQTAVSQNVVRSRFVPGVVPETHTGSVRYEAVISGAPASVVFEYDGVDRAMFDNGTNGDVVAGDGTWTTLFTAQEILSKNTPERVFRPIIGFCKLNGVRFNELAEIWTSEIGLREVRPIGATGQETDYVANYVGTRAELDTFEREKWAKRFYATHGDNYDFLNFVLIYGPRGNRFHGNVQNKVQGISAQTFDTTKDYGSAGRLLGWNMFPLAEVFDGAERGALHEIGHQWINRLEGTPFASGIPHWAKGDAAINIMGFSIPGDLQGGEYGHSFTPNGSGGYIVGPRKEENLSTFNSLELYLIGLAPPEEVGTYFVLKDQNQNLSNGQVLQPSEITLVTINDVIAARGARVPSSANAQKNFRVATIIVSEQLLNQTEMSFYDYFARRTEAQHKVPFASGLVNGTTKPWFLATGGRSVLSANIADNPAPIASLANISTRLRVGTGDDALIGGFILSGTQPKKVMLRAIGPSLNVAGKLENPVLELYGPEGLIATNDDWQNAPNKQEIIDSTIPPNDERESAIVATLPANNSAYTAVVRGVSDTTGVALVEGYDLSQATPSRLANISTRGVVQTGDNAMIGGFIILGSGSQKVVVRAIGPSLPVAGKLANPTLELFNSNGDSLAFNDNWRINQQAEVEASTIPPSNELESAIVATLPPAAYTAVVRGANNAAGVALVEVYALQ